MPYNVINECLQWVQVCESIGGILMCMLLIYGALSPSDEYEQTYRER